MARSTSHSITSKLTAQPHPDATLLRLMNEHATAQARVEAAEIALDADPRSLSDKAFDRLCARVLYRPRFLRHRIEAYAASAAIGSCLCRTAFGVWKPCRAISQVEL